MLLHSRAGYRSARQSSPDHQIQLATHGRSIQKCHFPTLGAAKKSWRTNGDTLVVPASDIMRILFLGFPGHPKIAPVDTAFRSAAPGGYSAGLVDQAVGQAEVRRDLDVARFIDLMLPISFKSLLKYLRRYSLVNYGKLLERKRGGYTHNIGINGL
jgi:hypothetical protein